MVILVAIWIAMHRIVQELVIAMKVLMMLTMMMMVSSMVATGSGGQEMEQLKLIKQPLIYCHQQSLEKF